MARPNNDTVDSFLEKYPHLKKQWDYEKNKKRINEDKLIYVTNKYWWKCAKDHSWEATITSRKRGLNCPICSGHKILKGYNNLASQRPDLLEEWDFEKNTRIFPDNVTEYSNKKVWWICKKHHSWQAVIGYRALGFGCPVCASRKLLPGYNDLATKRPDLAEAWDYEKDDGLTPQIIMPASNRKVWWRCKKGHSYQSTSSNRLYCIESCYYCNGKRVLAGFNDIATTHPEALKLWDYEKNTGVDPTSLSAKSLLKVWWKCENGHSWMGLIRSNAKGECTYCAGRYKGKTRFIT